MRVSRIGLAVVKGTRHQARSSVELARHGPVGDRLFCLVDAERRQVLKTVKYGSLIASTASWNGGVLSVEVAGQLLADAPVPTGTVAEVDYWGRRVDADILAGPWAEAFSDLVGLPVLLARVAPGEIVYGGRVSLVTTTSLAGQRAVSRADPERPERALDPDLDSVRFRTTFVIDTSDGPDTQPGAELAWIGRELRLGDALIRLSSPIVRCAMVDLHPSTGQRDLSLLKALPRDAEHEPIFGLQGEVVEPGLVEHGASVALMSSPAETATMKRP